MENIDVNLWGKNMLFSVDYNCYFDNNIQEQQKMAYKKFIDCNRKVNDKKNDIICLESDELEKAKKSIVLYLKKENNVDVNEKDFLCFVEPIKFFIPENLKNDQLFLEFENVFDDEHGIAIEFINNKFSRIGDLDITLV